MENPFNKQSATVFASNFKSLHRKNNFTFKFSPTHRNIIFENCIFCVCHLRHSTIFNFDYIFSGIYLIFVAFNPMKTIIQFKRNLIYEFENNFRKIRTERSSHERLIPKKCLQITLLAFEAWLRDRMHRLLEIMQQK